MWPAKITSITGSSSKPVYLVRFKAGGDTETVFAHEIKAIAHESRKRKADAPPGPPASQPPPPPASTSIISAAAEIDPALASQARKEPSKVGDGPARPAKAARKVKANKELEAGKNKWQDFKTKGKGGKAAKKESMFRTPEGVNARGKALNRLQMPILTALKLDLLVQVRRCARIPPEADTSTNRTERMMHTDHGIVRQRYEGRISDITSHLVNNLHLETCRRLHPYARRRQSGFVL